ncbi:hypothetical protein [Bradyrhizobium lupini]|uniref:hypothetical protein n=1 Tax=Rhizobium lupini TaxID=136996 RepID=UPI0034C680BF
MNEKASKPLTGLIRFGYALLCCLPLWLLLPFASAALYSSPSTDDFCLASQNLGQAAAAVHQYYVSVTGRLPALIIITLPSLVASGTHLDLFVVYPLFNFLAFLSFIASLIASATLLLRTNNYLLNGLFGLLLGSAILSIVPNISEFVYWVTGEACYLTAAIGASLFVTWTTNVSLNRARISAISFLLAGLLCAFTAMLNEFTGFILLGAAVLSLLFRLMTLGREAQVARHLVFIGIILLSYSVVLLSPSNVIRLGAYDRSGDISASLDNAMIYLADYCYTMGRSRGIRILWDPGCLLRHRHCATTGTENCRTEHPICRGAALLRRALGLRVLFHRRILNRRGARAEGTKRGGGRGDRAAVGLRCHYRAGDPRLLASLSKIPFAASGQPARLRGSGVRYMAYLTYQDRTDLCASLGRVAATRCLLAGKPSTERAPFGAGRPGRCRSPPDSVTAHIGGGRTQGNRNAIAERLYRAFL